jgi:hypothetical protein
VGQIGLLEFFPANQDLEALRSILGGRKGLSGASIFTMEQGWGYMTYSEFFRAPEQVCSFSISAGPQQSLSGGQLGIVVQNYVPR